MGNEGSPCLLVFEALEFREDAGLFPLELDTMDVEEIRAKIDQRKMKILSKELIKEARSKLFVFFFEQLRRRERSAISI